MSIPWIDLQDPHFSPKSIWDEIVLRVRDTLKSSLDATQVIITGKYSLSE